jgi:DNA replication initiation complex subunit (GINS family)
MPPASDALTYEDVTNIWREEKKSKVLANVRKDFYPKLRELVQDLKRQHEQEVAADPYSTKARLLSQQINKLNEKAQQIFEFRTEKILLMALRATASGRADVGRMSEEEKSLFDSVLDRTKGCRAGVLASAGRPPALEFEKLKVPERAEPLKAETTVAASPAPEVPRALVTETRPAAEGPALFKSEPRRTTTSEIAPKPTLQEEKLKEQAQGPQTVIIVRVLEDIPPFAGPKCTYKLMREDVATLPATIGKALVAKGKAVEIKPYRFE